jgi:hypothetical protein
MDPAFILTAKEAYHGEDRDRDEPRPRGRAQDGYGGGYGGYGGQGGGVLATSPWQQEVEAYVRFLFQALGESESPWDPADSTTAPAASAASEETIERDGDIEEAAVGPRRSMPINLHRGAVVAAEYHARWPDHAQAKLPGAQVAPLEIHYVRIEEENRPAKLAGLYQRQAGRNAIVRESDGGGWIDALVEDPQTHERRSVDIRIYNDPSGAGVNAELRPSEERPIVVEILTISVPNQAASAVADVATENPRPATDQNEDLPF